MEVRGCPAGHRGRTVLIVPLWNWNERCALACFSSYSFNRTFMELKSQAFADPPTPEKGFNRTFMELKYSCDKYGYLEPYVLIVPLWNWNSTSFVPSKACPQVLIVPLWNWNMGTDWEIGSGNQGFNRTFMELKSVIDSTSFLPKSF